MSPPQSSWTRFYAATIPGIPRLEVVEEGDDALFDLVALCSDGVEVITTGMVEVPRFTQSGPAVGPELVDRTPHRDDAVDGRARRRRAADKTDDVSVVPPEV